MPVTLAPERLVNTVTEGVQRPGDVAVGVGRTATVWLDESSGGAAHPTAKLRLFNADGTAASGEISLGAANEVAIAASGSGFVVARINLIANQQLEITTQRYDAGGQAVGSATVVQSLDTRNSPTLGVTARGLDITPLSDGGYAVGWTGASFSNIGQTGVTPHFVVVGANGVVENALTGLGSSGRAVGAYDAGVTFTELPNHQVLVTYALPTQFQPSLPGGQFAQLLDLSGQRVGAAFRLDAETPADGGPRTIGLDGLSLGALPGGKVAVAWLSSGTVYVSLYTTSQLGQDVVGRTPPMRLTTSSGNGEPQVVVLPDGRFLVGWSADGEVVAQVFSPEGQTVGALMKIGTISLGVQDQLKLALGPDGTLAALWQDPSGQAGAGGGADPSGLGVKLELSMLDGGQTGGPGRDTLTGGAGADVLVGAAGDDVLIGAAANDTLQGGVGGDSFNGGAGDDRIDGGSNTDFVSYADSPVAVTVELQFGFAGGGTGVGTDQLISIEAAYGSIFSDVLNGNYLSNLLVGNDGNDTLYARSGTDYVDGGVGTDLLNLDGGVGDYFITNGTTNGGTIIGPFGNTTAVSIEQVRVGGVVLSWTDFTSQAFNGLRYVASNPDLIASIGTNVDAAKQHWMTTGQAQGRSLDGFDPLRYAASNPDLQAQFYIDTAALTRHFIQTGFAQNRPTNTFDAFQYGAANDDLLLAFGADAKALTRHYVVSGVAEHRPTSGFDPLAYGAANDDLARFFGTDSAGLFNHWINSGVFEGRQPSGFDAVGYVLSNPDVQGLSIQNAVNHWLTVGADAGLRGDELFGREQASHALTGEVTRGELKNFDTSGRFSADRDWYQISLSGSARVSVLGADSGRGTLGDPRVEIYDSTGRLVGFDEDGGAGRDAVFDIINNGPTATRTFYIVVRSQLGNEGTYEIQLSGVGGLASPTEDGWVV
jgi:hypothetical protein